jgi:hypothetical protein
MTAGYRAPRETHVVVLSTLGVAELVVAFFVAWGAFVAAIVDVFLRAIRSRQRSSRITSGT